MARKRRRIKGRGKYCVIVRRGKGKGGVTRSRCFPSAAAAKSAVDYVWSAGRGKGVQSVLAYRRGH